MSGLRQSVNQFNEIQKQDRDISFKVIVIGESGVGKTSLIYKYMKNQFKSQYNTTVGVDFSSKLIHIGDDIIRLQIWDTCGQDIYHSVISSFYRGASAVFLVYAINSRTSFQKAHKWLDDFYSLGSQYAFIFLIGTKVDMEREVTEQQAQQFMKEINGVFYIETSSITGEKINELFEKAAGTMLKCFYISAEFHNLVQPERVSHLNQISSKSQNISEIKIKKKKCC